MLENIYYWSRWDAGRISPWSMTSVWLLIIVSSVKCVLTKSWNRITAFKQHWLSRKHILNSVLCVKWNITAYVCLRPIFWIFDMRLNHLCVHVGWYGWDDRTVFPVALGVGGQRVVQTVWEGVESEQEFIQQAFKLLKVISLKNQTIIWQW